MRRPRLCSDLGRSSLFTGISPKPSDGLEPSTPSLPWKVEGVTIGHEWSRSDTKSLQTDRSQCVQSWPLVYGRYGPSGRGVDALGRGRFGPQFEQARLHRARVAASSAAAMSLIRIIRCSGSVGDGSNP
jgi:hypothetical protein